MTFDCVSQLVEAIFWAARSAELRAVLDHARRPLNALLIKMHLVAVYQVQVPPVDTILGFGCFAYLNFADFAHSSSLRHRIWNDSVLLSDTLG